MPLSVDHEQLMVLYVGCCLGDCIPVVGHLTGDAVLPHQFFRLEVYQDESLSVTKCHDGLVWVRECGIHEMANISHAIIALSPLVDLVERKELSLLAGSGVDERTRFHVGVDQMIPPPREPEILWLHLPVVVSAEIQVFKSELLVLGCHAEWKCYEDEQHCHQCCPTNLRCHHHDYSCSLYQNSSFSRSPFLFQTDDLSYDGQSALFRLSQDGSCSHPYVRQVPRGRCRFS